MNNSYDEIDDDDDETEFYDASEVLGAFSTEILNSVKPHEISSTFSSKPKRFLQSQTSVIEDLSHEHDNPELSSRTQSLSSKHVRFQDAANQFYLELSLEQILSGSRKAVQINRLRFDENGVEVLEDKVFEIVIQPGTVDGASFTFPKEGDQLEPEAIPSDVVINIREKPHPVFKRTTHDGADLECIQWISRSELEKGTQISIPTLEGDKILLSVGKEIEAEPFKILSGLGLPHVDSSLERGDLIVRFEIIEDLEEEEQQSQDEPDGNLEVDGNVGRIQGNLELDFLIARQEVKVQEEEISVDDFVDESPKLPQDPPIEEELYVTLKEILKGKTKRLKITRKVLDPDRTLRRETKIVKLEILPGMEAGERIRVPKLGDKRPGVIPSDIIFVIRDKPNAIFTRVDAVDIEYVVELARNEVDLGSELKIPTLDTEEAGHFMTVHKEVVSGTYKRIEGKGLPFRKNPEKRGDILVRFRIKDEEEIKLEDFMTQPSKVPTPLTKDPQIEHDLFVSLEDILRGKTKKVKITKRILDEDRTLRQENKVLEIHVKPGMQSGSRLTFPEEGDRSPGVVPADIVFVIYEKPHAHFKRSGDDLEYRIRANQIRGSKIVIPTLEQEDLTLDVDVEQLKKDPVKRISYRGLPSSGNSRVRGDLVIYFEIDSKVHESSNYQLPKQSTRLPRPPSTKIEVPFTLVEILKGCKRIQTITRKSFNNSKETSEEEIKSFPIEIKPGTESGTRIIFPQEGNLLSDYSIRSDLIFIIRDADDPNFKRIGPNLEYTAKVTSSMKDPIEIPSIEGKAIFLALKDGETLTNETVKCIYGRGLPYTNDPTIRGNILVKFEIVEKVSEEVKVPEIKESEVKDQETKVQEVKVPETKDPEVKDPEAKVQEAKDQPQPKPIDLPLTLEEMLNGCTKKLKIKRKLLLQTGEEQLDTRVFEIEIKPGMKRGDSFTFTRDGATSTGSCNTPIKFIIQEKPHRHFRSELSDIIYTLKVTLKKALCGFKAKIPTLEKEKLLIEFPDGIVSPSAKKEIQNRGLPFLKDPRIRGNLVIQFEIDYPKVLTKKQKLKLAEIFEHKIFTDQVEKDRILKFKNIPHESSNDLPLGLKQGYFKQIDQTQDLECRVEVTLEECLFGCILELPTLDGIGVKQYRIRNDPEDLNFEFFKVKGEGFPYNLESSGNYGDLFVKFEVVFPDSLSVKQKSELIKCLPDVE